MAAVSIRNRVRKLEAESSSDLVVLSRHHTETDEQAKARWKAEIPASIWSGLGW